MHIPKYSVYSFRTYPYLPSLIDEFGSVTVLDQLKYDIQAYVKEVSASHPRLVIGIANTIGQSRIEPIAINRFNRSALVMQGGSAELEMFVPNLSHTPFISATKPTTTFCNYAMYRVQYDLMLLNKPMRHMFVHLNNKDLPSFMTLIETL